ncbi:hypothetical protein D3C80_1811690 [compost metagenome]
MSLPYIIDEAKIGFCYRTVKSDFFLVIGPHLYNSHFCVFPDFKDGQRHTYMIVQVAFCSIGTIPGRQHFSHQFFGRCLTVGTGNGNKRDSELTSMMQGQLLQGLQHICH